MTITVFVGDSDDSIAIKAKEYDPAAYLVDYSNFEYFLKFDSTANITVYTAHSDLPKITNDRAVLYEVLKKADVIYYAPPLYWSDQSTDFFSVTSQKSLTLYFLSIINSQKNNVIGLDLEEYQHSKYLALNAVRNTNKSVVWSAGCSIANGAGVGINERYSSLVASAISKPLLDLSKSGGSIEYAADQILRSDVRKNDIIIWGLTEEARFPEWDRKKQTVVSGDRNVHTLTETRVYKSLTSVHQVINVCNKIGINLILIPIICSENFCLLLSGIKEFYKLPYQTKFVDYGSDNLHPGKKQHQIYSECCLKIISNYAPVAE